MSTVAQLRQQAKSYGIKGYSRMNKRELSSAVSLAMIRKVHAVHDAEINNENATVAPQTDATTESDTAHQTATVPAKPKNGHYIITANSDDNAPAPENVPHFEIGKSYFVKAYSCENILCGIKEYKITGHSGLFFSYEVKDYTLLCNGWAHAYGGRAKRKLRHEADGGEYVPISSTYGGYLFPRDVIDDEIRSIINIAREYTGSEFFNQTASTPDYPDCPADIDEAYSDAQDDNSAPMQDIPADHEPDISHAPLTDSAPETIGNGVFSYKEKKQTHELRYSVRLVHQDSSSNPGKWRGASLLKFFDENGLFFGGYSPFAGVWQLNSDLFRNKPARGAAFIDHFSPMLHDCLNRAGLLDQSGNLIHDGLEHFRVCYYKATSFNKKRVRSEAFSMPDNPFTDGNHPGNPMSWDESPFRADALRILHAFMFYSVEVIYSFRNSKAAQKAFRPLLDQLRRKLHDTWLRHRAFLDNLNGNQNTNATHDDTTPVSVPAVEPREVFTPEIISPDEITYSPDLSTNQAAIVPYSLASGFRFWLRFSAIFIRLWLASHITPCSLVFNSDQFLAPQTLPRPRRKPRKRIRFEVGKTYSASRVSCGEFQSRHFTVLDRFKKTYPSGRIRTALSVKYWGYGIHDAWIMDIGFYDDKESDSTIVEVNEENLYPPFVFRADNPDPDESVAHKISTAQPARENIPPQHNENTPTHEPSTSPGHEDITPATTQAQFLSASSPLIHAVAWRRSLLWLFIIIYVFILGKEDNFNREKAADFHVPLGNHELILTETRGLEGNALRDARCSNADATLHALDRDELAQKLATLSAQAVKNIGRYLGLLSPKEKGSGGYLGGVLADRLFLHMTPPSGNRPRTYTDHKRQICIIFD